MNFLRSKSGRLLLVGITITMAASAAHVLLHSTFALASFVLLGIGVCFWATASAMADGKLGAAVGAACVLPVLGIVAAVGIGAGAEGHHNFGYLFALAGIISAGLALAPGRDESATNS